MKVEVISPTVQRFNGTSYYLCGPYFQRKGVRLHRMVWEYHNGEIPEGYHIHHRDADKSHNDIENLEMLKESEHLSGHMKSPERVAKSRMDIEIAREAASKWHGSEAGFDFHSKLAKAYWETAPVRTFVCDFCGGEFQSRCNRISGRHFCHQNCKAKYRRRRLRRESEERALSGQS